MKVHIYKVIIGKGSRATIVPHQSVSSLVHSPDFEKADEFNSMLRYLQQEFYRDYGGIYAEEHETWLNERLNGYIEEALKRNHMVAATYRSIESAIIDRSEILSEDLLDVKLNGSTVHLNFKPMISSTFSITREDQNDLQRLIAPIINKACEDLKSEWYHKGAPSLEILTRHVHHEINRSLRHIRDEQSNLQLIRLFSKMEANARQKLKN